MGGSINSTIQAGIGLQIKSRNLGIALWTSVVADQILLNMISRSFNQ